MSLYDPYQRRISLGGIWERRFRWGNRLEGERRNPIPEIQHLNSRLLFKRRYWFAEEGRMSRKERNREKSSKITNGDWSALSWN